MEPTSPARVVYMATAIPSLINPIEDFIATLSAASRPAIGASMMMKPTMVPSRPSFISVSEAKAPKPLEPRRRSASDRNSSVWSMRPAPCVAALVTRLRM